MCAFNCNGWAQLLNCPVQAVKQFFVQVFLFQSSTSGSGVSERGGMWVWLKAGCSDGAKGTTGLFPLCLDYKEESFSQTDL